jgi:dephospho-CoA kinase
MTHGKPFDFILLIILLRIFSIKIKENIGIMEKIVLTGNIGAGKSTIIRIFQQNNVPLFDADACIQEIYDNNFEFKQHLENINSDFIINNKVIKSKIMTHLQKNPDFIDTLENILYPILAIKRQEFIEKYTKQNVKKVVFEVPLLFEKKLQSNYNTIILVYAPYATRLERALHREGMTKEKFDFMNNRQIQYIEILESVDLAIDTTLSIKECEHLIMDRFFKF